MKRNRESGFTLFELMMVISIMAILSALTIPNMIGYQVMRQPKATILELRKLPPQKSVSPWTPLTQHSATYLNWLNIF